ncbi:hypothetical protein QBC35DRAFT_525464 [Podospora australis]|uniref:NB-ARC domain-containing protein n=1 Tax=Podospora australis TaxID=1536484 RepID=A0AAN6WLW8_9PEZI|nr:hypothetical protein QBC35DRAFT_525464 [Podospora australis]
MSDHLARLDAGKLLKGLEISLNALQRLDDNSTSSEPEVTALIEQLDDLVDIVRSFEQLSITERRRHSLRVRFVSPPALLHLQRVLESIADIIDECGPSLPLIESRATATRQREDLRYVTEENHGWYDETYLALKVHAAALRALSTAIDLINHQHNPYAEDDAKVREERSLASTRLHFQIGSLEQKLLALAIEVARAVTVYIPAKPNKYFFIARPARTYFTGRERQLAQLEEAFHNQTQQAQQRFVVYGLSGSGKSELAFKFADEYNHMFWGVFFVDASSRKNASSSYAEIATIGGVEPNEKAAKHWLATREPHVRWLLIIDNADDDEIRLEDLFPGGNNGCVLVTTRNPAHMTHGNAGQRSLELRSMEPKEAEALIIKAAEQPHPWPDSVVESEDHICKALGFLPLALVQAAKAILKGGCEWAEYLNYYHRKIEKLRRDLHGRGRRASRGRSRHTEDDRSFAVFSTYEILYEGLVNSGKEHYQDAVELLHVFSFFHFQNIRFDVLVTAALNPLKEEDQQEVDGKVESETPKRLPKVRAKPWIMRLRELRAFVNIKLSGPTPLPSVIRHHGDLGLEDLDGEVQVRLRDALAVLIERSLWVRERPEMSTAHQALWCGVSLATLSSAIRMPPHGDSDIENAARRELLPHLRHARDYQSILDKRLRDNAQKAGPFSWALQESYGRPQVQQDVRFSRVYAETGHWIEAKELQERALAFVSVRLGPDHPIAIMVSMFLVKTLYDMSEMYQATKRQRETVRLCRQTWGDDHPLTLEVTELLGAALYMKGRWAEATQIHSSNLEKMKHLYGVKHEKYLRTLRNLARLRYRYMDYDTATAMHQSAWEGMKETLGATHLETLTCLEDLAMSYLRHEDDSTPPETAKEQLRASFQNMTFIHQQRKEGLGTEHPYTLLMMHTEVLSRLERYQDAEEIFRHLVDKSLYRPFTDEDGDHPDRLSTLWLCANCFDKQGKFEEALSMCHDILKGLATIGGNGLGMRHKMLGKIQAKAQELEKRVGR